MFSRMAAGWALSSFAFGVSVARERTQLDKNTVIDKKTERRQSEGTGRRQTTEREDRERHERRTEARDTKTSFLMNMRQNARNSHTNDHEQNTIHFNP